MIELKKKYYYAWQFFGCYFHQDWDYEVKNDIEAINNFISQSSIDSIRKTVSDLENIDKLNLSEKNLEKFILKLSCCYYPPYFGETFKSWLDKILRLLKEGTEEKSKR